MSYYVDRGHFTSVQLEWEQLLTQSSNASVFLTPHWQRTWWEQFGSNAELCLMSLRQGNTLRGIAPLMQNGNTLSFLGHTDLFDYHDFIYPKGTEASFFHALLDHLEQQEWTILDLHSLPENSPTLKTLPELCRKRGYSVSMNIEGVAPGVTLPSTWSAYLAQLRKKDRHELRRKFRRLEGSGPYHHMHISGGDISEAVDDFLSLMRASNDQKRAFLTAQREQFFRHVLAEMSKTGHLNLSFLEIDGKHVASVICLDYANTRFLYNSGYNTTYAALSVGLLLNALCLKDAIERRLTYFDFLRGSEEYKYRLGAKDVILHHLHIQRAFS